MGRLVEDFKRQGFELIETHISWVFLGDKYVYKVKKPVNLGFLDFTTLEARKRDCETELALNRRLAPDTYLEVVPIARDAAGCHTLEAIGPAIEWAVRMRRLNHRDAADVRLAEGRLSRAQVRHVAKRVARFHQAARCDAETSRFGHPAAISDNVEENFEQTRVSALAYLSPEEFATIEAYQRTFLRDQASLFEARVAAGRVRDGHGDLRLEHIYLGDDDSVSIIDCIEFSDRFRYADVCADIGFLSMDLLWHDRHDLSEALLAAYAEESQDYDLYGVIDFYESYRAYVRGKVTSFLADDEGASDVARQRAAEQARRYYLLAEACAKPPMQEPVVYAACGLIASGKSTFANALSEAIDAPVIEADRTRKHLAGVEAETPLGGAPFDGSYSEAHTARVYGELLRRAAVVLDSGRPVVLDASFRAQAHREAVAALAHARGIPCVFALCEVPREVAMQRLAARAQGTSTSDGRAEIYDDFAARFEPVGQLSHARVLRLDTRIPVHENVQRALSSEVL